MKITAKEGMFAIEVSRDQLVLLNNAINETLNAIEDWEFQTRTGAAPEEARRLLAEIGRALDR